MNYKMGDELIASATYIILSDPVITEGKLYVVIRADRHYVYIIDDEDDLMPLDENDMKEYFSKTVRVDNYDYAMGIV